MKRSEINRLIDEAAAFAQKCGFRLPPFAFWPPDQWRSTGSEADEIRACGLGWDLTDFGSGQFNQVGLILFTIRNGHPGDPRYRKSYCEKLMVSGRGQVTPMHFHWSKCEDIINRSGADLAVQVYNATPDDDLADTRVEVSLDGLVRTVPAGETLLLSPGESIFLPGRLYHSFWGANGRVLIGEVSAVNDDAHDNRFHGTVGRFPEIEEDEPPRHLLFSDY
jgi:D-lyxose ketol-isomerase